MRIMITGGTGLIGRALSANLVSDGHEVIVLSRSPRRVSHLPAGVRAERWDARTAEGWGHLADGADAIVNLAGANLAGEGFFPSRWTDERKRLIRDSRLNAGRAVVEAVEQAEPEAGRRHPVLGHRLLWLHRRRGGCRGRRARRRLFGAARCRGVGTLDGSRRRDGRAPGHHPQRGGPRPRRRRAAPPACCPSASLPADPWAAASSGSPGSTVEDEARAIRFLIEHPRGQRSLQPDRTQSRDQRSVCPRAGPGDGPALLCPGAGFAMKLAFGEVTDVLLEGQRGVPKRLLDLGFEFQFPVAEAALQDLLK